MQQLLQKTLWLIAFLGLSASAWAQVTLPNSGTYTETFDGIGTALPTGWDVRTGATATALGTTATFSTAAILWNNTTGAFKNFASGDIGQSGTQASATDRALGLRQTGTVAEPGGAFVLQLNNTIGYQNFALSFKLQSLDATSPRTATWRVDYGFGTSPASFVAASAVGTLTTGGSTFSNNTITANLGAALDNQTGPVWIRIVVLTATTGSGNRPSTGIDDFTLTYSVPPTGPTLTVNPVTISGFSTPVGTPSVAQSYTVTGSSLTADVTVTAPAGYEVSQDGTTYASSQTVVQSGGSASAIIRVRLTGVVIGSFSGNITNTSTGVTTQNVAVSGNTVDPNAPTLSVMPGTLSGFSTTQNTPSAVQSYSLTGANLSADVAIVAPVGYQVSQDGSTFFNSLTVTQSGGTASAVIRVRLTGVSTGTFSGTVTNTSGSLLANLTVSGTVSSTVSGITLISAIQGTGTSAALTGTRTIEGIVTRAFPSSTALAGFFVQEEDADSDGNPLTSEGISVYDPANLFTGNVGDRVRITGNISEFTSVGVTLTQITPTTVLNLGASTLPSITPITFPVANVGDLERYEGMLVTASASSGSLVVTEYFELGRYGSVVLSSGGLNNEPGTDDRLDQFTQFYAPNVANYAAYLANNARRSIVLDDASGVQNPPNIILGRLSNPLSASNTLRGGDAVSSITAILDHRFGDYRLQTATGVNFQPTNPRPANPPSTGAATLKVASFNILNYFTSLDTNPGNNNGPTVSNGNTPPNSYEPRGASTSLERTRQFDKLLQAIYKSEVDVMGLNEVENNGFGANSAIQSIVDGLNSSSIAGPNTYTFINSDYISTDAITVAIIYKQAKVTPIGSTTAIPYTFGTGSFDVVNRRSLAQTFQQNSNNEIFTVVANHWKSKGSSAGGAGDTDTNDGQAQSNGTRTRQAQDLRDWLATKPTGTNDPDYLILGDLNAYAQEDPLTTLYAAGYTNLVPNSTYSYVFDGQVGALDHGLRSASLQSQITGADKWHINSDEPNYLDYSIVITASVSKTPAQIISLYAPDQFRTSDHDPVIIGLNLGGTCLAMTTVKAGAWNDPTVWSCNRVPTATDNVTVKHSVTMPAGYLANAKKMLLDANGKLTYALTARLLLNP
jgi:predicted extracellular nuclease